MFPLIGALGSIGGGILGAMSADNTAATNWQINLLNYYQREQERKDAIRQAQENKRDAYLGTTDASGNRTSFVPGQGWVSTLSPETKAMKEQQDREQMNILTHDLPAKRASMDKNIQRQREEEYVAGGLLDEFKRVKREPTEGMRRRMINASVGGINDAFGSTSEDVARTALRSGNTNSAMLMADLNKQKSKALQQAFMQAQAGADTSAENDYNTKRSGVANLYNMFATRAGQAPNVSFNPQNLTGTVDAASGRDASRGDAAMSNLLNAFGKQGGTLDYTQPNNGWANAVGGAGAAIAGMGDKMDAQKSNDAQNALFQQFLQQKSFGGFPMSSGNSGAW